MLEPINRKFYEYMRIKTNLQDVTTELNQLNRINTDVKYIMHLEYTIEEGERQIAIY